MTAVPVTLPLPEIVERLNALKPLVLYGYAAMLARLAVEQRAGRLRIAPIASRASTSTEAYEHPGTTRRLAALDAVAAEIGATRNQVVLAWLTVVCGQETPDAAPAGNRRREVGSTCHDGRPCFSPSSTPSSVYSSRPSSIDRHPDADLRLELLVLRHQLGVLQRQVKRPRWRLADRLLLAGLGQRLPRPTWSCFLVSPQTLLRWHRALVRRKWSLFARRPRRGRPGLVAERRELILRLARENTRCYRRIQGELLKLGVRCSHETFAVSSAAMGGDSPARVPRPPADRGSSPSGEHARGVR